MLFMQQAISQLGIIWQEQWVGNSTRVEEQLQQRKVMRINQYISWYAITKLGGHLKLS